MSWGSKSGQVYSWSHKASALSQLTVEILLSSSVPCQCVSAGGLGLVAEVNAFDPLFYYYYFFNFVSYAALPSCRKELGWVARLRVCPGIHGCQVGRVGLGPQITHDPPILVLLS